MSAALTNRPFYMQTLSLKSPCFSPNALLRIAYQSLEECPSRQVVLVHFSYDGLLLSFCSV